MMSDHDDASSTPPELWGTEHVESPPPSSPPKIWRTPESGGAEAPRRPAVAALSPVPPPPAPAPRPVGAFDSWDGRGDDEREGSFFEEEDVPSPGPAQPSAGLPEAWAFTTRGGSF
jgi:hypothetical protein